jgi:GMP synthase-like glutamine amidotransferase
LVTACLVIQHLAPEGPYAIATALTAAGVDVDVRRVHTGDPLPDDLSDHVGLVVMGGPMSAHSDEGFPTRRAEIGLLAEALATGTPVLGVCLGAQLLAAANQGQVFPGPDGPEVGWGEIVLSGSVDDDPLLHGMSQRLQVLHWHWDTFEPGPDAVHLAASPRYHHQAVRVGPRAWGFQFHLEVDEQAVAAFVDTFGGDADQAGFSSSAILKATPTVLSRLVPPRDVILRRFAAVVSGHRTGQS